MIDKAADAGVDTSLSQSERGPPEEACPGVDEGTKDREPTGGLEEFPP